MLSVDAHCLSGDPLLAHNHPPFAGSNTTETLNVVDEALVWGSCSILLHSYLSMDEESLAMSIGLEEFVDPHVITNIEWKMLISDDLL